MNLISKIKKSNVCMIKYLFVDEVVDLQYVERR